MLYKQTVNDIALEGKTVLLRTDYNVPLSSEGTIRDDFRIQASIPTLEYLLSRRCRIVIVSHLGRPKGQVVPSLSLRPVAQRLADILQRDVTFVSDSIGDKVYQTVKMTGLPSIILLENVRFHPEEEQNSEAFARSLAESSQADYFIQDGFGAVHRAHATTDAITHYLPSVAGPLLELEISTLTSVLDNPERPLVAIFGGAKISDKISVISQFIKKADKILIGGAMANTFLAYNGYSVGNSLVEDGQNEVIKKIYDMVADKVGSQRVNDFLLLPIDAAVGTAESGDTRRRVVPVSGIGANDNVLDIGDETIALYEDALRDARTVIWNGPLGYSESPAFAQGSQAVAQSIVANENCVSIIGGGDTADFVRSWDTKKGASFSHVSTGGGASLDLLAGKVLPGFESLLDAKRKIE